MKYALYLLVILTSTFLSCTNMKDSKKELSKAQLRAATLQVIHSRKSVRHFTDRPVSEADLETLVRAGMAAPTGKNLQPWSFFIVTDRDILDALAAELPTAKMVTDAPAAIVICGDLKLADTTTYKNYWVMDCSAASENILLAAEAMGLGACWTASFPYEDRMETVRNNLNLPGHLIPLNVIPVGYPEGMESPKNKWMPSKIYRNRYSPE